MKNGNGNGHKLTKRQEKLIENIKAKKHQTLTQAAKDAGYAAGTPHKALERTVRSVLGKYLKALERAGATDKKSARVIAEGMDAMRQVRNMAGHIVDETPDHKLRLSANEQYLKVKRLLDAEEKGDAAPANIILNVIKLESGNGNQLHAPRFAVPDIQ